jgi:hypothetical protein
MFQSYDLERPTAAARISYADLAREHGLDVTTVTNRLHAVRKRFRAIVLERRHSLPGRRPGQRLPRADGGPGGASRLFLRRDVNETRASW